MLRFILCQIWYRRIAIAVPNINAALIAPEILIEDISIAVLLPPLAQLSIPAARQNIEQLLVLHRNERKEILVTEVSLEVELFRELLNGLGCYQLVIKCRLTHPFEI